MFGDGFLYIWNVYWDSVWWLAFIPAVVMSAFTALMGRRYKNLLTGLDV